MKAKHPTPADHRGQEYIVVTDHTSKVLKSTTSWYDAVRIASLVRRGGGQVTIFKATKG